MKNVLITGCAGFIGFHLALHLKKRGDFVIGIDNFNAYYPQSLKRKRAWLLKQEGIVVFEMDLRDKEKMQPLFSQYQLTHVVNLAAQAGVRHSLHYPQDYVASNLEGFVSILEVCRQFTDVEFIYASSSSVYGLNHKIPFSVNDPTDQPANLYGATKKANELIAHAYHHLYKMRTTGLRYFTVYGPWGRPDMAYYRFAHQIFNHEPIQVFNFGKMQRDFTYIDDIIEGTVAAIDLGQGYQLFNLGHHRSISLSTLIELLELSLQKKAILNMLPLQPGEVIETYADIKESQEILHYAPKVSFEQGIFRFIEWFQTEGHQWKDVTSAPL